MRHPREPTTARSSFQRWRAGAVLDEMFRRLLASSQPLDHVKDRLRDGRRRDARVGEGAAARVAGHPRARHVSRPDLPSHGAAPWQEAERQSWSGGIFFGVMREPEPCVC
jgi:hypothetical protein